MPLNNDQTSDLDLLTFRYVAAELSDEEMQQFELQLAEDQDVREAVAKAVQVAQAVVYAQPAIDFESRVTRVKRSHRRRGRRLWVVAASAAAIAFVAGLGIARWLEWSSNSQPAVVLQNAPPAADIPDLPDVQNLNGATTRVVALWSASATEFEEYDKGNPLVDGDEAALDAVSSETWDSSEEVAFNVPSWMLAAVSPDDDPEEAPFESMPEEN